MATIAAPGKRTRSRRPWIIGGGIAAVVIIAGLIAALVFGRGNTTPAATPGWSTATVQSGTIDATVNATGNIEPQASADLRFLVDGAVTEVLVAPGDSVRTGQPLARLDDSDLRLALERAQADLKQAESDYQQLLERATPAEIKEAEARLAQARAQYRQVAGSVSQADIAAARARLESARAQLAAIESGNTDLSSARTDLARAQAQFASQRDQLSLNKTNAQFALEQSVNELTQAQASYATAKQNWDYVERTGADPANPTTTDPRSGRRVANKLNSTQRQQYYDTFVQAEAALRSAESSVERARVNYDQTRQAEVTGVDVAQRDLEASQARVSSLEAGGAASQVASARAAVNEAQAQLNKLVGAGRAGDLESAQANIDIAQAALERLTGDPKATELARAEASKDRAGVTVKQAERDIERATLTAPFAGTIATVGLRVGERAGQTSTITLADLRSLHVDVPIDELDVAQVKTGQPVRVAIDALPDRELNGTVTNIAPLATRNAQGTNTFTVEVTITDLDPAVRPGMTATAQIVTERKEGILLAPRRAIVAENGKNYVYVPSATGQPDQRTGRPASERREVQVGLSNNEQIEIVSGLASGDQVLVQDVVSTFNPIQQR